MPNTILGEAAPTASLRDAKRSVQVPHAPFYEVLIIGKKKGKLLTASIIEFDLLFNAHAYK
ncbi:MAG: hypothetical protein V7K60_34315 [Nostoc sp.]